MNDRMCSFRSNIVFEISLWCLRLLNPSLLSGVWWFVTVDKEDPDDNVYEELGLIQDVLFSSALKSFDVVESNWL